MNTCPICKRKLVHNHCSVCKLTVRPENRTADLDEDAPGYAISVYDFIYEVINKKPILVISKYPIDDPNFSMSDCYFMGCNHIQGTRTAIGSDMPHLIAGGGFIASRLKKYVYFCVTQDVLMDPLRRSAYKCPEEVLFEQALLADIRMNDPDIKRLVYLYMSPLLESVAARYLPGDFAEVYQLSDEQALFSVLCNSPCKNIKWDNNPDRLEDNIKKYMQTCLQDLDEYKSESEKVPRRLRSVLDDMLSSHPSVLVNQCGKQECYFDVMDYKDVRSVVLELDVQSFGDGTYKQSLHVARCICENLFKGFIDMYGLEAKHEFLAYEGIRPGSTPDETVIKFWQTVYEKIFV